MQYIINYININGVPYINKGKETNLLQYLILNTFLLDVLLYFNISFSIGFSIFLNIGLHEYIEIKESCTSLPLKSYNKIVKHILKLKENFSI